MINITNVESPLGDILLAEKDDALIGLWIEEQKYYLGSLKEEVVENDNITIFNQTKQWLDRYFRGEQPKIGELKLSPIGSEFRQAVWKILCEIPYGVAITYGEIAKEIARQKGIEKMSAQAVGGAVGHNPISIIIPCHRVVGMNGSLTGYAGGIDKKIKLLIHEGIDMDKYFVPKKGTAL